MRIKEQETCLTVQEHDDDDIQNGSHSVVLGYVLLEFCVQVLVSPSVGLFSVSVVVFNVFTAMSLKNVVLRRSTPCNLL